jgi:hypothetical protein
MKDRADENLVDVGELMAESHQIMQNENFVDAGENEEESLQ